MKCYYDVTVTKNNTRPSTGLVRTNGEPYVSFKSAMGAAMEMIHIASILNGPGDTFTIDVLERAEDDRGMRRFSFTIVPSEVEGY